MTLAASMGFNLPGLEDVPVLSGYRARDIGHKLSAALQAEGWRWSTGESLLLPPGTLGPVPPRNGHQRNGEKSLIHRWTPGEDETVRLGRLQGMSVAMLAKELRLPKAEVRYRVGYLYAMNGNR